MKFILHSKFCNYKSTSTDNPIFITNYFKLHKFAYQFLNFEILLFWFDKLRAILADHYKYICSLFLPYYQAHFSVRFPIFADHLMILCNHSA